MDLRKIPDELLTAGRSFLAALRELGLNPEGCTWVYDARAKKFILWVVWSGIDRVGPLALSRLFFKAYNSNIIPKSIDPFLVEFHSPSNTSIGKILEYLDNDKYMRISDDKDHHWDDEYLQLEINGLWLIYKREDKRAPGELDKQWRRFSENVEAAAA